MYNSFESTVFCFFAPNIVTAIIDQQVALIYRYLRVMRSLCAAVKLVNTSEARIQRKSTLKLLVLSGVIWLFTVINHKEKHFIFLKQEIRM